jgi:hypothetical protein
MTQGGCGDDAMTTSDADAATTDSAVTPDVSDAPAGRFVQLAGLKLVFVGLAVGGERSAQAACAGRVIRSGAGACRERGSGPPEGR